MRKFTFCYIAVFMALSVFLFSGCGGGSLPDDSSSSSAETEPESIPNNKPNKYNASEVFSGSWAMVREDSDTDSLTQGDVTVEMHFISSQVSFDKVSIGKDSGNGDVNVSQEWVALVTVKYSIDSDTAYYRHYTNTYRQTVNSGINIVREGQDRWRCDFTEVGDDGETSTAMDIKITSPTTLRVNMKSVFSFNVLSSERLSFYYNKTIYYRKMDEAEEKQ